MLTPAVKLSRERNVASARGEPGGNAKYLDTGSHKDALPLRSIRAMRLADTQAVAVPTGMGVDRLKPPDTPVYSTREVLPTTSPREEYPLRRPPRVAVAVVLSSHASRSPHEYLGSRIMDDVCPHAGQGSKRQNARVSVSQGGRRRRAAGRASMNCHVMCLFFLP